MPGLSTRVSAVLVRVGFKKRGAQDGIPALSPDEHSQMKWMRLVIRLTTLAWAKI